nr:hypothetical protein [Rhodococcus sp. (in: high G+C Gram-positive bacteria)]
MALEAVGESAGACNDVPGQRATAKRTTGVGMAIVVELQHIGTAGFFGHAEFDDRAAAEDYATAELVRLGETPGDARAAAKLATNTPADASARGYAVRIV